MSTLKLFVSHSSRLDDIDHQHADDDHNWQLLANTCEKIRQHYGNRVEILVDKDGLIPGEDWNHQLNLWLAECHVAIILFSKRAIEKSHWVAKEAAILSWRAEIDPAFKLIPILLDGQATPEDLQQEFAGTLQINRSQCIRNARDADDVLRGVQAQLGEPDDLATSFPDTPLERLQGGIATLLADETTEASLEAALAAAGCDAVPIRVGADRHEHCARHLARRLMSAPQDAPYELLPAFQQAFDALAPRPAAERALRLFRDLRALWVDPAAAAGLPRALRGRTPIVLAGAKLLQVNPDLGTRAYTLERYIERAWPGSQLWIWVTVTRAADLPAIRHSIHETVFGAHAAATEDPDDLDEGVRSDPKRIVLVVDAGSDGAPDMRRQQELQALFPRYPEKLLLVFAAEPTHALLPEQVRAAEPALDPRIETRAYLAELGTCNYLKQTYGR